MKLQKLPIWNQNLNLISNIFYCFCLQEMLSYKTKFVLISEPILVFVIHELFLSNQASKNMEQKLF